MVHDAKSEYACGRAMAEQRVRQCVRRPVTAVIDRATEHECRAYIAVAEACWRQHNPSYSWHIFDWMCWKQRCRLPLLWGSPVINLDCIF